MSRSRRTGNKAKFAVAALGSSLAGAVNGMLGTGAGTVFYFICLIVYGGGDDRSKDHLATAMAAVFPLSVISLFTFPGAAENSSLSFFTLILPAAAGGLAGALLAGRIRGKILKSLFAAVSVAGGVNMILR